MIINTSIEGRAQKRQADTREAIDRITKDLINGNYDAAEKTFIALDRINRPTVLSALREQLAIGDFYIFTTGVIARMGELVDIHVIGR